MAFNALEVARYVDGPRQVRSVSAEVKKQEKPEVSVETKKWLALNFPTLFADYAEELGMTSPLNKVV